MNDSASQTISLVDARIAEIEAQIAMHKKELDDLRTARRVLGGLTNQTIQPVPEKIAQHSGLGWMGKAKAARALTTKEIFLKVLSDSPEPWMTANEIQEKASVIRGSFIPMNTVSPTLSEMKSAGQVARNGMRVALPERIGDRLGNPLIEPVITTSLSLPLSAVMGGDQE